jgi:hypothetical protein
VATPIAALPWPDLGSGMEISFRDCFGEPISENGLLIVHRKYQIPVGWMLQDLGVSNKVVEISNGKAVLPNQWVVASLWLMPNPFSFYLFPMPYTLPQDDLEIVPLIPGCNYHGSALKERVVGEHGEEFPSQVPYYYFNDGVLCLSSSVREPQRAIMYLESYTLPYLRRANEKRARDDGPDLCLSDEDYRKVISFIRAEIERIRLMQAAQSQPATAPP